MKDLSVDAIFIFHPSPHPPLYPHNGWALCARGEGAGQHTSQMKLWAEATEAAQRCGHSPLALELLCMGCHVAGDCGL